MKKALRGKPRVSRRGLELLPAIAVRPGRTWRLENRQGVVEEVRPSVRFAVNDPRVAVSAAVEGLGIVRAPLEAVEQHGDALVRLIVPGWKLEEGAISASARRVPDELLQRAASRASRRALVERERALRIPCRPWHPGTGRHRSMMSARVDRRVPQRVEAELARTASLLATLFDTAEDAIFLMEGDRFVDCNPATLQMFGCRVRDDIVGQTPFRFSPDLQPDGSASAEKALRFIAAAIDGTPQHFEWRHCKLDRTEFDVEVRLNRCVLSGAVFLVAVVRDMTARVRAEKALAASERYIRELFDATNEGLFICDEDGIVLDVNERACAMFGFDRSRVGHACIAELSGCDPSAGPEAIARIQRAIHHGPQTFDWQCQSADGASFWSEIAVRAFRIEEDVRVIASVRDITERKLAALERERLMTECQAASDAKDQFLAVLSHELRNPLAAIQAGIGVLRYAGDSSDPRALRALEAIERNVKLQTRFVNDLLDLSRLTRGKLALERGPLHLGEVVLAGAEGCSPAALRAGVLLEARADPGIWVDGDPTRIQQVVINLVENAIKFTAKGGRVTLSVVATPGSARLLVEDTGVGIEASRLSDIFEMFSQGQIGAHRAPGLGIGLALVKSLVELHGGRVWVESEGLGRGSRFVVELPRREAPEQRGAVQSSPPARPLLRVLLVEDNDDARAMLAEALSHRSYEVLQAESGEAALDLLARERVPVDAIVADVGLPGIDGYELLRRARRIPFAADVPALALTGFGQERDLRQAREAGYAEHLVKPVDVEVIDERIRAATSTGAHRTIPQRGNGRPFLP